MLWLTRKLSTGIDLFLHRVTKSTEKPMLLSTAKYINQFVILLNHNHIFVSDCGFMKSIVCFTIVWLMTVTGHGYTGMSCVNRKILILSVFFLKFNSDDFNSNFWCTSFRHRADFKRETLDRITNFLCLVFLSWRSLLLAKKLKFNISNLRLLRK